MNENVEHFKKNKFCIIRSALSKEMHELLTQYALFDEMQGFHPEGSGPALNDIRVANAHSRYGDPAMEALLLQLHKLIQENTGLELFPTYSYFRVYRPGDVLPSHTDRPACEVSMTLCFGFNYGGEYKWPIYLDGAEADLHPGDLAIYRGVEIPHWRETFNPPSSDGWHVQGFFHYVDANGPNASWKYDQRQHIGEFKHGLKKRHTPKPYIHYTKG
jgi:hypothetical protein